MTTALEVVESAASGRILVAGSLPPEGRDLDLLVMARERGALQQALRAEGFLARGNTWARFEPLELVDLEVIADPTMLARSTPLPGFAHVCVPDPADALRLLAEAHARDRRLTSSRRTRAASTPPEVWKQARSRGSGRALAALHDALRADDPGPGFARRIEGRIRRVRSAGVITLSGVDGSGKTTQAELLRETLSTAGFDTVIEWNRFSHDRWLDTVARPLKQVMGRGTSTVVQETGGSAAATPRGARGLWILVVALANALAHNRSVRRHTLAGRIVICDRYVLDSLVQLSSDYPPGLGNRLAVVAVRTLSPRPLASFYLAVPPDVAAARKPWWDSHDRLLRHAEGYETEFARLGVVRLDATQPLTAVAAEIARETWRRI